ncbi:hypothetical protein TNCV_115091 [Trichonephila clavipes]|nr:hypothetical protein TNCV_115091 [Trichonephila clavipes]
MERALLEEWDRISQFVINSLIDPMPQRYKNDPFLTQSVASDEKWTTYCNVKCRRAVCCPSDPPASTSKAGTIECGADMKAIYHSEVLSLNQIINAAFYCLQLDRLRSNVVAKCGQVSSIAAILSFITIAPDHMLLPSLAKS